MSTLRRFLMRLASFLRPGRADAELARELASHLAMIEDDFRRRGLAPADARSAARRAFGGGALARDVQRDARSFVWLEEGRNDMRHALGTLRRRPGFAAASIATLALGIGASTAIFSVAYGVSLRPLPYWQPDRLARLYESSPANGRPREDVSEVTFHEWRQGVASLAGIAIHSPPSTQFLLRGDPQPVVTMSVSTGFFDVLGASPVAGRGFTPADRRPRGTEDEAVLSFAGWQRLYGGQPGAVGSVAVFSGVGDDDAFRIVGVMPEGFGFGEPVDFWRASFLRPVTANVVRGWRYDRVIARLRSDATLEATRAELESVAARLARDYPATNRGWTAAVEPLHDAVVGSFGRATGLLLAAVALVLLMAVVNVGGLLAARGVVQARELAVRAALGAGSWRLLRLRLAETSVLSGLGAGVGLLLAWLAVAALRAAAPPGIPRLDAIAVDWPTVAIAAASALLSVIVFIIGSHRPMAGSSLAQRLRGGAGATGGPGRPAASWSALTVAQCAGAAALVVLAVMLTRSLTALTAIEVGWDADRVLSLSARPPVPREVRRPWFRMVDWSDRLIARLEATPGVERAAVASQTPLAPRITPASIARGRGRAASDGGRWPGVHQNVTDGYFELMGIRLLGGRLFDRGDRFTPAQMERSEPVERGVAVVSASAARALWPGRSPIGESIWLPDADVVTWREVVGVVEDLQFHTVGEPPALHVFTPWTQMSSVNARVMIKSAAGAAVVPADVRRALAEVEPGTFIDQVAPLDAAVARATAQPRFTSRVVSAFSALALLLAAVGIHGTLSYMVAARTREIGVRLSLGATRRAVVWGTVWRGLRPAIAGGIGGLAIALGLAQVFRATLFGVEPLDARSFAAGGTVLLLVAVAATLGPARRVARIDPSLTLRAE